jgi:hypothetical protein
VRDNLKCYGLSGTYRWVTGQTSRKTRSPAQGNHAEPPQSAKMVRPLSPRRSALVIADGAIQRFQHANSNDSLVSLSTCPLARTLPSDHPDQWVLNYCTYEIPLSFPSMHTNGRAVAEQITPWMCPILRADNECKTHVLPLAMSSQLVFDALAATSYHRLAYYGSTEFAIKAERYKTSAFKGLLESCQRVCSPSSSSHDRLFAAATLLILMYDEMVAAQDYFTTLARIMGSMRSFVDFSSLGGSSELRRYLVEQFGM